MTILLTGATGFVGRNLLLSLLKEKKYDAIFLPVRDVSKLKEQLRQEGYDSVPPEVKAFRSEADDWKLNEDAARATHVVHAAGVIFARTRVEYWQTNTEGTLRLFRALKNPSQIVVLSSLAAAGPSSAKHVRREEQAEAPVTWYGQSKLEMERQLAQEFSGWPYICLRPPMIFGARDHATLPLFKMVKKPIHFKAGFRTKQYSVLAVDDLSKAILVALNSPLPQKGQSYFVAHREVITDKDLLRKAASVCGQPSRILAVPQTVLKLASRLIDSIPTWRTTIPSLSVDRAKEIWPNRWVVSTEKFEKDFGWSAQISFTDALRQTREWYLQSGQLPSH
jgi:nucleoside-diphosphate-sugar epimerase